jgi:DNA-binding CsgD family transcriptional regulator
MPDPFPAYAMLALYQGKLGDARELVARGRELAGRRPEGFLASLEAVLGLIECAEGDAGAAIAHFAAAEASAEACGWREPADVWWRADFAEALLDVGRVDEAVELLDAWESDARRLARDRVLAHVTRCRGLVAAARGDVDLALATLEQAVDQSNAVTDPFGGARALLALGVTRLRARQKRGAREAIAAALAGFESLGAVMWTKRARAELGRIGGRTQEEGLTPAERRVAALVVEGRTNQEVAAALFLAERTVETHLSHIYAKLGIRSRTELARVYEPVS